MTVVRQLDSDYGTVKGYHVDEMLQKHWGSTHTVRIFREPSKSLGISIVGGKVDIKKSESNTILGIFVKNVVPDSPAGRTGQFKTGDRILEVSGIDLRQASHETAVKAIRNASNPVTFMIQSLIPWNIEGEELAIEEKETCPSPFPSPVSVRSQSAANKKSDVTIPIASDSKSSEDEEPTTLEPQPTPSEPPTLTIEAPPMNNEPPSSINEPPSTLKEEQPTTNEPPPSTAEAVSDNDNASKIVNQTTAFVDDSDISDDDDEEDVREMEGRTVSTAGQPIDRASAANVKRSREEAASDPDKEDDFGYTMNKVKKKYASLGHTILMVQLERSSQGLGLSLAGHKDRNCMAVFVCGLNPNGAAYKTGGIQIGDEILEVNGVVLHGRCHLNASAIIKGLSGPIFKVIILRRKTAIDDIAVKPITQFPVSLAEEASEEQFSASYPNVRTIAIKKQANQSLGIMIIEGKHAEVGQGIFISDIQEGSSAEKAGLEIGEMILAVNKDSLVNSTYDTAANLLKRTEGLVQLVVSNPKKEVQGPVTVANDKNAIKPPETATLKPSKTPSRPTTPVPEPPADLSTCPIIPGKDTVVEIQTDNKGLGICFVGGKDTLIPNGIVIIDTYVNGTAEKDGRLQPGDQILDVNGTSLKDVTQQTASQALRQTLPKMKLTVYRPATIEFTSIDVDLVKKPSKGLGLSIKARKSGKGAYIADIIPGGLAEIDGRLAKGDLLVSVNGQNVDNLSGEEVGAILKTVTGRASLKLNRYKTVAR